MKRAVLISITILISLILLPVLAVSAFWIYLNCSLDAEMIHFSIAQAVPAIKAENKPAGVPQGKVKNHTELSLKQMPPLVPKVFVFFRDTRFYTRKSTKKVMLRDGIRSMLVDWIDRFEGGYGGCCEPDIIGKLAITALRAAKKRRPLYSEITVLAAKIDEKYSRDQILESYLNRQYFGDGVFGVADASRYYFGKPLATLQPHQIVLLYVMSYLGPEHYHNSKILMKFRNDCLERLARGEVISKQQAEEYKRRPLDLIEP